MNRNEQKESIFRNEAAEIQRLHTASSIGESKGKSMEKGASR
jgi:hypothetical protein